MCGGGTVSRSVLLFRLCVCCHSIVGLGWCLCDRVVSLRDGGGGLCVGWNGGGVMGVYGLLFVFFSCLSCWCSG